MFGTCREAFESITSADVKLDDDAGIGDRVGQRVQGAAFLRDLTARGLTGVRLVTPRLAAWSTQTVRPCPPRAGNAAAPCGCKFSATAVTWALSGTYVTVVIGG